MLCMLLVVASPCSPACGHDRRVSLERKEDRVVDHTITFTASNGPLIFGATKEGMMAVRVHDALRVAGAPASTATRPATATAPCGAGPTGSRLFVLPLPPQPVAAGRPWPAVKVAPGQFPCPAIRAAKTRPSRPGNLFPAPVV